ncbi:MAG: GatB/YqeY domain-containing protein [Thiovulaceae bacterium]|nr:GatB/YqeY domain-containing protein [Sulfurimonadaceae bacterium]
MSQLRETINNHVKEAMKAKDTKKRDALRLLTSAIKQIEVDERKEFTDADIVAIIQKQIKQRQDAIEQYKTAERQDLIEKEELEINYYLPYLPKQLTSDELESAIKAIIEKVGASSMKDMGKVMGVASKDLAGTTNGKAINEMVKKLLA